jgi:hypothetical protein
MNSFVPQMSNASDMKQVGYIILASRMEYFSTAEDEELSCVDACSNSSTSPRMSLKRSCLGTYQK